MFVNSLKKYFLQKYKIILVNLHSSFLRLLTKEVTCFFKLSNQQENEKVKEMLKLMTSNFFRSSLRHAYLFIYLFIYVSLFKVALHVVKNN